MRLDARQQKLLKHTFLDYQSTAAFEDNPLIVSRAEGVYYWDTEGKRYFDGIGGILLDKVTGAWDGDHRQIRFDPIPGSVEAGRQQCPVFQAEHR